MTAIDLPGAAFLRAVLSQVPAYIVSLDSSLRIQYTNRLARGFALEQVVGHSIHSLASARHREQLIGLLEKALATGQKQRALFQGSNDEPPSYFDALIIPYQADGADERSICLIAMDVTDHVTQSMALRESEEKLRVAVEGSGLGLWTWDVKSQEVTWNERLHQITGLTGTPTIDSYISIVHPDDRPLIEAATRDAESAAESQIVHRIITPDGDIRWVSPVRTTAINDQEGNPTFLVGGIFDVTEQRRTEERLRDSQKMDALGNLTAGVAHNFNNMLAIMMPAIEAALPAVDGRVRDLLADAAHAARRSADMVAQLMTFTGQRRTTHPMPTDLCALIERVVAICRQTFDRRVILEVKIDAALPPMRLDQAALEQVLFNLLLNARDAVATNVAAPARIQVSARVSGDRATIAVTDNGPGIPEAIRSRIFEPFFTTKATGKGTGLGLSVSLATIREHDGTLEVSSQVGHGTTVTIALPLDLSRPEGASQDEAASWNQQGRILVIDDEAAIRRVVGEVLEMLGHEVSGAADVATALDLLHVGPPPDLILLDRSMPETVPTEAVHTIRAAAPSARLVFFTGQDVPDQEARLVDGILHKPLAIDELENAIGRWMQRVNRPV